MDDDVDQGPDDGAPALPAPWWARLRIVLPGLLTTVAGAGIALALVGNSYASTLREDVPAPAPRAAVQRFTVGDGFTVKALKRDAFRADLVVAPPSGGSGNVRGSSSRVEVVVPSGPVAPAGQAQEYAAAQIAARGWAAKELACLVPLWARESGWNAHAGRPNGPYGIPQAYPGTKMASAGADWLNDYRVQIRWGLGYIAGRYGTPCGAWAQWQTARSY